MRFIKNGFYVAEKTLLVLVLCVVLGLVGNGENFSIGFIRTIVLYGALLGFSLGVSTIIFEIEKLPLILKYLTHFAIGYILLNVLEGLIFEGVFLPSSPPINYIYKFIIFCVAYATISFLQVQQEKLTVRKMAKNIAKIKEI